MKRILFLAPQPFFIERGTPIAVKLALTVLGERGDLAIDLLTYHEGKSLDLKGVTHYRIPKIPGISHIGPGLSLKKLVCDVFFAVYALFLALKFRKQYTFVHAVEESVFMALFFKWILGIPYLYDMDSNLSGQVVGKRPWLKALLPFFCWVETLAVRNALAVIPVCDSLGDVAQAMGSRFISILRDISLLSEHTHETNEILKELLGIPHHAELILYIGNLETYQGIDLLLEGFANLHATHASSHVVIIGGTPHHIDHYKKLAEKHGVLNRVHFVGPRPVESLGHYIAQADILVSPRTQGENTPMKIYSYLHSGKAILATDLGTHRQVLSEEVSVLCAPVTAAFSQGLLSLLTSAEKRARLGAAARKLAENKYTFEVFRSSLNETYNRLLDGVRSENEQNCRKPETEIGSL